MHDLLPQMLHGVLPLPRGPSYASWKELSRTDVGGQRKLGSASSVRLTRHVRVLPADGMGCVLPTVLEASDSSSRRLGAWAARSRFRANAPMLLLQQPAMLGFYRALSDVSGWVPAGPSLNPVSLARSAIESATVAYVFIEMFTTVAANRSCRPHFPIDQTPEKNSETSFSGNTTNVNAESILIFNSQFLMC